MYFMSKFIFMTSCSCRMRSRSKSHMSMNTSCFVPKSAMSSAMKYSLRCKDALCPLMRRVVADVVITLLYGRLRRTVQRRVYLGSVRYMTHCQSLCIRVVWWYTHDVTPQLLMRHYCGTSCYFRWQTAVFVTVRRH